jgi:hypothetical protein
MPLDSRYKRYGKLGHRGPKTHKDYTYDDLRDIQLVSDTYCTVHEEIGAFAQQVKCDRKYTNIDKKMFG